LKKPDVLTLDIEMPRMDGIEFLKRLMPQHPLPVVVVSALAAPGARATLEALEYGAVDFVLKPSIRVKSRLSEMMEELKVKIHMAAQVDVSRWRKQQSTPVPQKSRILVGTTDKVIAIGASTGGTVALRQMISEFPQDMPGTIVVQHMPPIFTRLFAERLNELARVEVKEAISGDRVLTGRVLVAPGDIHLEVIRSGGNYQVKHKNADKVNGHRPSVDVLFNSVAKNVGSNAVGIMLTGMGRDGAEAMLNMRQAGARAFAQDKESSVVFGMPKAAFDCGGAERLVGLNDMTATAICALEEMK
jgi:two-component system chemotaxis response regulator CheB